MRLGILIFGATWLVAGAAFADEPAAPSAAPPPAPAADAKPAPTDDGGAPVAADASASAPAADAVPAEAAPVDVGAATAEDAAAEPAKDGTPKRDDVVEVRIVGNKADSLQKIPGSGYVITDKDIQRARPYDVAEMLRRMPGVQVRQEYGGGNRLDISVRGLDSGRSRRVLLLEDGIPIALNPYSEPDMNYSPAVEQLRGIEMVKGSGSILFGPQTTGGVINFLTLAPPTSERVTMDVEGGDYGYFRGLASYGDTVDGARYVVSAFHKRGNGFRSIAFNQTDALGKVTFDTGRKGQATLKLGIHNDTNDSDAVGLTRRMYEIDPRRPTVAPNDAMYLWRYSASLTHEHRFTRDTKLTTLAYGYYLTRVWRRQDWTRSPAVGTHYEHVVGDPTQPLDAIYFPDSNTILDRSYAVGGLEPRLEHRFNTGPIAHTIDTGARLLVESANYAQGVGTNATTFAGSKDYVENHLSFAGALYLQDRMAFRENLLVTPGIRLERALYNRSVLRQGTAKGPMDVNISGQTDVSGVIPGIGIVYGSKNAHAFGGMHLGWAPPRMTTAVSARGVPAQVSAELSTNYELGMRFNVPRTFRAEGTGFVSLYKNQVVSTASAGGVAAELADGGPTRIFGGEAAATFTLGALAGWGTTVDLGARYTHSRATFASGAWAGNFLPYAPLHSFNANLDIEHPTGFGGQIAYSHVSDQFTDFANTQLSDAAGNVGLIPSRNIVDVTGHFRHKASGLTFKLTVKNATDDVYIWARRPNGIFVSGVRQIILGVRWEFDGPRAP